MKFFDVVVVGLGPAGMTAAVELAERGLEVAVFDENPRPGGQVYRQPPSEFKRPDGGPIGATKPMGQQLIDRFNRISGSIRVFQSATIWGIFDGRELTFNIGQTSDTVGFNKLILCEGACERTVPFPGWTLPGVMTLGAIQKFILNQGLLPGRRILLSGTGPLLLAVAAEVIRAGGESLILCEASNMKGAFKLFPELFLQKGLLSEAVSHVLPILRKRVPVRRCHAVIAAKGDGRVEAVEIARLNDDWKPVPGTGETIRVDLVGLGFGFQPMARLCRLAGCRVVFDLRQRAFKPVVDSYLRTSRDNIYAAGDSTGIGGSGMAAVEGHLAAIHAASELGAVPPWELDRIYNSLTQTRSKISRYINRLDEVFTPRSGIYDMVRDDTVICRCEASTAGDILGAIQKNHLNLNTIKKSTRLGMGPCQGKTCEAIAVELGLRAGVPLSELEHLTIRPPITPTPMSLMAGYVEPEPGTR